MIGILVVAALTALSVALADQVGRESRPFERSVDRGFAALMTPLARASTATGSALAVTLATAADQSRIDLVTSLAQEVQSADATARRAERATPPEPASPGATACQEALIRRSVAAQEAQQAVDGLLGGPTGAGRDAGNVAAASTTLASAARNVAASDAAWSACRTALRRAPGRATLPVSTWFGDNGVWQPGAPTAVATAIVGSSSLAAAPALAVSAVTTDPPALALATGGSATLPATTTVGVSVVVDDTGNVTLDQIGLSVTLTPSSGGRSSERRLTIGQLAAGSSTVRQITGLPITPGSGATITVTAATSGAQAVDASPASLTVAVEPAASSASVVASTNPTTVGRPVTYTATITSSPAGAGPVTGTVTFADAGGPIPACEAQPLHHATATCTVTYQSAGYHSITVTYSGTASVGGTVSPTITETVRPAGRSSSRTSGRSG